MSKADRERERASSSSPRDRRRFIAGGFGLRWRLIAASFWNSDVLRRRVAGGSPGIDLLALDGRAPSVALDVYLEDRGVINEAVDGGQRHVGILEDLATFP